MKRLKKTVIFLILGFLISGCSKNATQIELPVRVDPRKGIIGPDWVDYSIYPNPFRNQLTINISGTTDFEIYISDETGRVKKINGDLGNNLDLDFSACSSGVYNCEIKLDGAVYRELLLNINDE